MTDTANINSLWGSWIVEELRRNGVRMFCLSPGSRCTPLTVAVAQNPGVEHVVHFDERGAAYHALGIAKATGVPVALVCTSGTAVANYLPAVVEAAQSRIPLILLTADRPPKLLDAGANQTIQQPGIFGSYARWEFTLPCPSTEVSPEMALTTVDQAVYRARRAPQGPVHLNCPYREPLAPTPTSEDLTPYANRLATWQGGAKPWTSHHLPTASTGDLEEVTDTVLAAKQGLLIVGPLDSSAERDAARVLAQRLGWTVFADITSGLRLGSPDAPFVAHYDLLLLSDSFRKRCQPDVVLHIGVRVTSKRLQQHLETGSQQHYILATNHPFRQDAGHCVTNRIEADLAPFCRALADRLGERAAKEKTDYFSEVDDRVRRLLEARLDGDEALTEPAVARMVSRQAPPDAALFLGNSMPIRDMDQFAVSGGSPVGIAANRGASGIDGNVATAAGIARGLEKPVIAVMGDLALLHDLNSLALVTRSPAPVILIVINNDGGGIFHFLPIAQFETGFEEFFAAPHGFQFEHAAASFKLRYACPDTKAAFEQALSEALCANTSTLIEVCTEREENLRLHNSLYDAAASVLD